MRGIDSYSWIKSLQSISAWQWSGSAANIEPRKQPRPKNSPSRLMHLAEEDKFISQLAQAEIKKALAGKPNATAYSHPGQKHAFARHNGAHYNAAAAALTNRRTGEFLNQQLR
jgi:dienelactone hydrolase